MKKLPISSDLNSSRGLPPVLRYRRKTATTTHAVGNAVNYTVTWDNSSNLGAIYYHVEDIKQTFYRVEIVSGTIVHLILLDGSTLYVYEVIHVPDGATLHIYVKAGDGAIK